MMKYFVVVLAGVCLVLTGCGKKASEKLAEKMIEAAAAKDGVKADVNLSDGKMTIKTKEGTATYAAGKGAKIPENFPKDVHIYDGATVFMAASVPNGFNLMLQTKDASDKVVPTMKSKMTADGWKEEAAMDMGQNVMLSYSKGDRKANVTVSSADKMTQITLTVVDEKSTAKAGKSE
jgi:hypothetical protein